MSRIDLTILQEALETQGECLKLAKYRHLSSNALMTLESFIVDGREQTVTLSSAIGLLKQGKIVSLKNAPKVLVKVEEVGADAVVNNEPEKVPEVDGEKLETEETKADEASRPVDEVKPENTDETKVDEVKPENTEETVKSENVNETAKTVEANKKVTIIKK